MEKEMDLKVLMIILTLSLKKKKMRISELIVVLEELKEKEGDLNVCISIPDEYWGSIDSYVNEHNFHVREHVQPDGPKSGKSIRAIVFG